MAAAAVVLNRTERASTSVIAFAADALVLQGQGEPRPPAALVDDLLSLRGKGRTDLALALRTAAARAGARAGRRTARDRALRLPRRPPAATRWTALAGLDRVDVLGTSDDPDAVAAGRRSGRPRARALSVRRPRLRDSQAGLLTLLA